MKGDPIYAILTVSNKSGNYEVVIQNSLGNYSNDIISINDAVIQSSGQYFLSGNATKYLLTLQFGIVKIEPLGYIESNETKPELEQEPSEP